MLNLILSENIFYIKDNYTPVCFSALKSSFIFNNLMNISCEELCYGQSESFTVLGINF